MSPAAATAALDRLERAGYIRRVRDQADRRRVLVEVTDRVEQATRQLYGATRPGTSCWTATPTTSSGR